MNNDGVLGGGIMIKICGVSFIMVGSLFLYVIDGFFFFILDDFLESFLVIIFFDVIESIFILKDVLLIVIYGVQGVNGVVLIIMKKGLVGMSEIFVKVIYGISKLVNFILMLGVEDYMCVYMCDMIMSGCW